MYQTAKQPFLKKMNIFSRNLILLVLLLGVFPVLLHAAPADSQQPITIEADKAKVDEKKGLSTYTGHVLLIQGGIQIKADELKVFSKNGQLDKLIATGKPVIYSQENLSKDIKKDVNKETIVGEAYTMEYYTDDGKLILLDKAKLSQGGNQFSGNKITYDTKRQVVSAAVSEQGTDRVQVTIQPKSNHTNNKPK